VREGRLAGLKTGLPVGLATAATVVILDRWTKLWAESALAGRDIVLIPGILSLHLEENPGAAFSFFQGAGPFLAVAAVGASVFITFLLARTTRIVEAIALGLIMGGAIGNLADRFVRAGGLLDGRVIDWIQLPNFPTFNLADSAITVGAVVLVVGSLVRR